MSNTTKTILGIIAAMGIVYLARKKVNEKLSEALDVIIPEDDEDDFIDDDSLFSTWVD